MSDIALQPYMLPELASKVIDVQGNPYNVGEDMRGGISQWAWASTVYYFKDRESISEEELDERVHDYLTQQLLDDMQERGLVESIWSEDGEIIYRASEKGRRAYETDERYRNSN